MFSSVGIIWASVRLVDAASVAAESLVLQAEHARHATTPHVLIAVLTTCQQTQIQDTYIIRNKSQVSRKIKYKDHIKNSYQKTTNPYFVDVSVSISDEGVARKIEIMGRRW